MCWSWWSSRTARGWPRRSARHSAARTRVALATAWCTRSRASARNARCGSACTIGWRTTRGEYSQSLANVLRAVADALRCGTVGYWKLSRDADAMSCELLYSHMDHRFVPAWSSVPFPDISFGPMLARLQQMRPVAVSDTAESELTCELIKDARWSNARSLLVAPVLLDAEVIGAICVTHAFCRNWDDDEIGFVATAALMVTLAD